MPDWSIDYNDVTYRVVRGFTSTVINEHIDQYTAKITNRFVPEKEHIQFKINKIWEDNNNEHNLRPSSIQVEIYGTNTAGATEGGELLDTITLTNTDISDTSGENTWTKLSNSIETNYNYFYAKEINGSSSYTATISPVEKVTSFTTIVNNLQNNSGIAPLAGFEDFIYLNKIWDDNNNEKALTSKK